MSSFSQDLKDQVVFSLQAENASLRESLAEYENLYGQLGSRSSGDSHRGISELFHPVGPGGAPVGDHASVLRLNFSQDGNIAPPRRFPNPYLENAQIAKPASPSALHASPAMVGGKPTFARRSVTITPDGHSAQAKVDDSDSDEPPTFPMRPSFAKAGAAAERRHKDDPHLATLLVLFDGCPNDPYHPSSMPIYQTATFVQPNVEEYGPYDYSRSGNPTRTALEVCVAKLEGAVAAFAFASGMAALHSLVAILKPGDRVLACSDLYGGMHRLLSHLASHQGLIVEFVDTTDIPKLNEAIHRHPTPKLLHLESPSNPLMKITDLKLAAKLGHDVNAIVSVDCTMMTPLRQQPLQLGCDVVVHSGTKFFSGHSDTMAGFVAVATDSLAKKIGFVQNAQGTALAPFDSWLILRGLKTLALRVDRQEINAVAVAQFLVLQTEFVKKLHYAGLEPNCPVEHGLGSPAKFSVPWKDGTDILSITPEAYTLHWSQCSGPGTVISFETGSVALSRLFVDNCRLFKLTVSFGSCNSLVEMPCALSHASIPKERRTLPEDLVRISVGVEHAYDLIADLANAIAIALEKWNTTCSS